jgi:thiamine kinase-like enzyme
MSKVTEFEHSPLEKEKGWLGQIIRLKLTYDSPEADGPRSIIAKFSSNNPEMRQYGKDSYEREVRFYQNIAKESLLPVPTCYYADFNTKSGWHVLLLEDLAPARSGSAAGGCSPAQARTAIKHIARFHAHWWENPMLDNIDWLVDPPEPPSDEEITRAHKQWWPVFIREVGKPLPDEVMEIGELLGLHKGRISRHLSARPRTLCHGDYHQANLMFGAARGRGFFVVDWHFMHRGPGISDVGRFLSGSLVPENRQAVEMDLLHDYVRILRDHGVRNYSFDDAMYDYRICLLWRFGTLISSIAAIPFTKEQKRWIVDALLPRNIAANLDNNCRSLLGS